MQLGFLLALRFLFGMFQAGTFPLLSRLMADWMPTTERGSAQGFIWMCSRAGGVLAPMVMVWLFHRLGNWRSPLAWIPMPLLRANKIVYYTSVFPGFSASKP